MRVSIVLDQHFIHTPDKATYDNGHATYQHWQRYLSSFEEVQVVGRSTEVSEVPAGFQRVDGPGVRVLHVPYYHGPAGLLKRLLAVVRTLQRGIEPQDAVIVRLSGLLGHLASRLRRLRARPFAAEIINDPSMLYSPNGTFQLLRAVSRVLLTYLTQLDCQQAAATLYVTRQALQRHYPPQAGRPTFGVSDVHLPPQAFVAQARTYAAPAWRAVLVGSLEQPHKAVDIAITALSQLRRQGHPAELTIVGDGSLRRSLQAQALRLGVAEAVQFVGQRSTSAAVRADLTQADLLLLPSRTEGLPRALVEAMAQGLPAVASDIGGISELVAAPWLVPPGDAPALAQAWYQLASDPAQLSAASQRNLAVARLYADHVLDSQRLQFLQAVRQATAKGRP